MKRSLSIWLPALFLFLASCSDYTYRLKGKRKTQEQKPSVALLNKIIDFREGYNAWPFSKEEFMRAGPNYREAFDGFPYRQTIFKVIDNNTMTFYFSENLTDIKAYERSGKKDLNSYSGEVRFYREKDKFLWKLKMY
jgi:hypothetical protein